MSRAAFAQALGTHSDKIKNVETGKQRVDHEILAALRQVFAVDLDELVSGGSGNGQSLPKAAADAATNARFVPVSHFTAEASAGHGSLAQDAPPTAHMPIAAPSLNGAASSPTNSR